MTYADILTSITKRLKGKYPQVDVIVDDSVGITNKCFYVTLVPINSLASTRIHNKNELMVSVKYFGDKLENYEVAEELEMLFARTIKIKENILTVTSLEASFIKDEVGDMLDFLIGLTYFKQVFEDINPRFNIGSVQLDIKRK